MRISKGIIDTTLRDGLQALWSSRLDADAIVPIAWTIEQAGFHAIDFMASVQFEVCVKHLQENPWDRVRRMKEIVRQTPMMTTIRGRFLTSFDLMTNEVVRLMIQRLAANGFRKIMILDSLHDIDNISFVAQEAKAAGLEVVGILFYTISPLHTNERYVATARAIAATGVDAIVIRDPSGLLTPARTRELVPLLRAATGKLPLYLKSHCNTGLADECYLDALEAGVDAVFTACAPLANGPSVPDTASIVRRASERGFDFPVDLGRVDDMARYFSDLAERLQRPVGRKVGQASPELYEHQVPGGMLSFLKDQLRSMSLLERLPEVLEEIPRVRKDFGYPVVVTPVSQLIGVQAVLNVVQRERYKLIPDVVRRYVLGHFGKPEGPLDPVLMDRVATGPVFKPTDVTITGTIEKVRDRLGGRASDDDVLLNILFQPEQLAKLPASHRAAATP